MNTEIYMDGGRFWKAVKAASGKKATEVNVNAERTRYYWRYLYRLLRGRFEITMPDEWVSEYVFNALLLCGAFAVTKYRIDELYVPYLFNVVERTPWRYPKTIVSGDGDIKIAERTVGDDAELVYLTNAWGDGIITFNGCADMLDVYAMRLALCDGSIDINLINSRTPWLVECEDKQDGFSMKALMTKIYNGEPAVFWRKKKSLAGTDKLPITALNVKQNYIAGDVQDLKRQIVNEFLTQVGIPVASDKKERVIVDEVAGNNAEGDAAIALWQYNLDRCCRKVNEMAGKEILNIKIKDSTLNRVGGDEIDSTNT